MKSLEIIKKSIKEINLQLKKKDKIVFDNDFQILGPKSSLDSLIIVNLFVAIEEKIKSSTGREINLLNESFFEKGFKSKFTLGDLKRDLDKKLSKK
tara:strand:+ start:341 stop:628 length:288 start_codon:yes stop_codon:yes gene_type:complete